jgi:hypothetical protein
MASAARMSEGAATVTESATVAKSAIMAESAMATSKVVSIVTPSTAMTPSIMIPSVTKTVATVVWIAPAVAVGRISTAVTVVGVVAALSRNEAKEK